MKECTTLHYINLVQFEMSRQTISDGLMICKVGTIWHGRDNDDDDRFLVSHQPQSFLMMTFVSRSHESITVHGQTDFEYV